MTANEFTTWLKQLSSPHTNWPKINPRLLDDDPEIVQAFFSSLQSSIEAWMKSEHRSDVPKMLNETLSLNSSFSTPYSNRAAQNLIGSIIKNGNSLGLWNLPVPQLAVLTFRQKSPFQPSALTNYADFQDVFHQHIENIKSNKHQNLGSDAGIGCALFSSAYSGGLIRVDLLLGLIDNIKNYKHTNRDAWIDFYDNQSVYFRWHPDPISELLLSKYLLNQIHLQDTKLTKETLLNYVNAYLTTFAPDHKLTTLSLLFDAVKIHFHLNLPEAVAYYLINPLHSTPLPTNAWLRYRGLAAEQCHDQPAKEYVTNIHEIQQYTPKSIDLIVKDQNKLLISFRKYAFTPSDPSGKRIAKHFL